jgi:LEA14-like dessication related protein
MSGRNGSTRRALGAAGLAALLAATAAVASAPVPARDEVTLALKEKVIKDLSSSGLVLSFHILAANPSDGPRRLARYRYRVRIDQKEYINTTVALDEPLTLGPGQETLIALPVKITYELLRQAIGPIGDQAFCDVVGEMIFRNERNRGQKVPFAFSGEFPIFQDPEIDLLPLKVKDLTVGGADVVFRPRFRNLNGYELLVDAIDYELYFVGRRVLDGSIPGDKSLPGTGEKAFAVPFQLDFFEIGDEVRAGFAAEELPCRFAGRIEIASVWGRLVIRFDRVQPLRLDKKGPGRRAQNQ